MVGLCEGGNEPAGSLKAIYQSTNSGVRMNLEMDTESRHVLETERVVIKDEAIESIFLSEIKTELEDYYEYERDGEPEYNPDAGENLIPCKLEIDDSEISVSGDHRMPDVRDFLDTNGSVVSGMMIKSTSVE
ncbi:hypothetical protein ANN_14035 [Periplaneta americana]|uniref:Uncharacterized protein n=1 Tax=Periplaneta americana TaxID=6978 RepID=A0ABQ8SWE3_PERAM|nr:hypothetical protein ANN_14035 [Periplaneta americana]